MVTRFRNREEAGRALALLLKPLAHEHPVVMALPRGGVPVGYEVARALDAPLEVLIVRKLGAPGEPELAVGAIAEGGGVYVDPESVRLLSISRDELTEIARQESIELQRRVQLYRGSRPAIDVKGRTVIVVDDGVARGASARAAIRALRERRPKRLVLAVPVIAPETLRELRSEVDDAVVVATPHHFGAVGFWYEDFEQVSDATVLALLARARGEGLPGLPEAGPQADPQDVAIQSDAGMLQGVLAVPQRATGLVIFAHGSGSSRQSPRNQHVARILREERLATLLLDLLTPHEEAQDELEGRHRWDIGKLADRLALATIWATTQEPLRALPVGFFGASTGAAAALAAAARLPHFVQAVVSRGGRPDLAGAETLRRVLAPTLLIVGSEDPDVLQLNREAMGLIAADRRLVVVPGASHLFEEPGALDAVARIAGSWFSRHLSAATLQALPEGGRP